MNTTRPYTITAGARRPRRAASLHGARVAMGRMMNNEPQGARGAITLNGETVVIAECSPLGWYVVDERFAAQVSGLLTAFGGARPGYTAADAIRCVS